MDYGLLGFMATTRILFTCKGEELAAIGSDAAHNKIRKSFRTWLKREVENRVNQSFEQEIQQNEHKGRNRLESDRGAKKVRNQNTESFVRNLDKNN